MKPIQHRRVAANITDHDAAANPALDWLRTNVPQHILRGTAPLKDVAWVLQHHLAPVLGTGSDRDERVRGLFALADFEIRVFDPKKHNPLALASLVVSRKIPLSKLAMLESSALATDTGSAVTGAVLNGDPYALTESDFERFVRANCSDVQSLASQSAETIATAMVQAHLSKVFKETRGNQSTDQWYATLGFFAKTIGLELDWILPSQQGFPINIRALIGQLLKKEIPLAVIYPPVDLQGIDTSLMGRLTHKRPSGHQRTRDSEPTTYYGRCQALLPMIAQLGETYRMVYPRRSNAAPDEALTSMVVELPSRGQILFVNNSNGESTVLLSDVPETATWTEYRQMRICDFRRIGAAIVPMLERGAVLTMDQWLDRVRRALKSHTPICRDDDFKMVTEGDFVGWLVPETATPSVENVYGRPKQIADYLRRGYSNRRDVHAKAVATKAKRSQLPIVLGPFRGGANQDAFSLADVATLFNLDLAVPPR